MSGTRAARPQSSKRTRVGSWCARSHDQAPAHRSRRVRTPTDTPQTTCTQPSLVPGRDPRPPRSRRYRLAVGGFTQAPSASCAFTWFRDLVVMHPHQSEAQTDAQSRGTAAQQRPVQRQPLAGATGWTTEPSSNADAGPQGGSLRLPACRPQPSSHKSRPKNMPSPPPETPSAGRRLTMTSLPANWRAPRERENVRTGVDFSQSTSCVRR